MNNISESAKTINNMYSKLSYFDQYGNSVVLSIFLLIILFLIIAYVNVMEKMKSIKDDWINKRCSPQVLPFAGLINKPENKSISEFTSENFAYCTQNIVKEMSSYILAPLNVLLSSLTAVISEFKTYSQDVRTLTTNMRNEMKHTSKDVYNKGLNLTLAGEEGVIKIKDILAKTQGVLSTAFYAFAGAFITVKSSLGFIISGMSLYLLEMDLAMMALAYDPFTLPLFFIALPIYITLTIIFILTENAAADILQVAKGPSPPTPHCFDQNTDLKMEDGSVKEISKIEVGDILENNNVCTGVFELSICDNIMYCLNGTMVTGKHKVLYNGKWIHVDEHPESKKMCNYQETVVYCLATSLGKVEHNGECYVDWSETETVDKKQVLHNLSTYSGKVLDLDKTELKKELDGGLVGNSLLNLSFIEGGSSLKDVRLGDILEDNIKVIGKVTLDGSRLNEQYCYNLGDSSIVGGNNLILENNKLLKNIENRVKVENEDKLYHLLTDRGYFYVDGCKIYDYNIIFDYFENI